MVDLRQREVYTVQYLVVTVQCPLWISVNLDVVLKSPSFVGPLTMYPLNDVGSLHSQNAINDDL